MKTLFVAVSMLHVALASHVSVSMPYQNPAGVTYINSEYQEHPGFPLAYSPPANAHIETHEHIGYAKAQIPAVAAVPYVHHVPTVSHIPVTRYETQAAVIEKQYDVAKPAISTQKYEVRRPAIQKHFYDIEERVVVRPAGSAVVELDEPTSKIQKGEPVIESLPEIHAHNFVAHAPVFAHSPLAPSAVPFIAHTPLHVAPVFAHAPVSQVQNLSPTSAPATEASSSSEGSQSTSQDEEVVVENADLSRTQQNNFFRSQQSEQSSSSQNQAQGQFYQQQQSQFSENFRTSQVNSESTQTRNVLIENNGIDASTRQLIAQNASPSPQTLLRGQTTQEENLANQKKLIDFLTARGGVTEVGLERDNAASSLIGDAGQVRARVISATPAPDAAEPTGERVSTRRVVVSRPIETLEEIKVSQPHTKLERISVQHPTYIHSQRLDHIQVHSSVPVVGKALTPAIAHAAVPVYQKTITPAYAY